LVDSLNLLTGNLAGLSKGFEVEYQKGHFPHKFVKENTLNYVGNTPTKEYFEFGNNVMDDKTYSKLQSNQ